MGTHLVTTHAVTIPAHMATQCVSHAQKPDIIIRMMHTDLECTIRVQRRNQVHNDIYTTTKHALSMCCYGGTQAELTHGKRCILFHKK